MGGEGRQTAWRIPRNLLHTPAVLFVVIVWLFVCPPLSQPTLYCETVSRSCGERFTTDMHAGETQKGNAVMIIIVKQSLKGLKRP